MYEITITEKTTVKKIGGKEWKVIDKRPYTNQEINDDVYGRSEIKRELEKGIVPIKEVMGYTPEKEIEETTTREVLKQTVTEIDLQKVIKAINKID